MSFLTELVTSALQKTGISLLHNWPYLVLSILIAAALKVFVDQAKVSAFLRRHQGGGIVGATAVAVTTPFCSCGTMALVLGMMANMMPWAPIIAFMVASPLTSPEEFFYSAGLFGWPFAIAFFASSILLGLVAGLVAQILDRRGWFAGQARFQNPAQSGSEVAASSESVLPNRWREMGRESWVVGRRLAMFFLGFAFIGYLINGLIPQEIITRLFGGGHIYGVPLAATLGVPLYINTEGSLPLVRSFLDLGMSPGATLAFLITGAGTSIGAITGALTIARWRVVGVVVGTLWVGAIVIGYAYNFLLGAGLIV